MAGNISRGDGPGSALGAVDGAGRAALSEGRQRTPLGGRGADAADLLSPVVVQLVGSSRRGSAL